MESWWWISGATWQRPIRPRLPRWWVEQGSSAILVTRLWSKDDSLRVPAHPAGDRDEEDLELSCHRVENLSKVRKLATAFAFSYGLAERIGLAGHPQPQRPHPRDQAPPIIPTPVERAKNPAFLQCNVWPQTRLEPRQRQAGRPALAGRGRRK